MLIREEQLHKLTLDIATVTKKNEELVSTYDTKLKLVEQNVKKAYYFNIVIKIKRSTS
jgi:hypothetical protein